MSTRSAQPSQPSGAGARCPAVRAPAAIVYDTNADALSRRVATLQALVPELPVTGTSSRTAVLVLAAVAEPGTVVLVDIFATDFSSVKRPGERLIRRLTMSPETAATHAVAWSAQNTADVLRGARRSGARGFVSAADGVDVEEEQLRAVLAGAEYWAPVEVDPTAVAGWEAWFERQYGITWEWWMEPGLVRLASGRNRAYVVPELVALRAAPTLAQATARLRQLSEAISGENKNSEAHVAEAAEIVLAHIAAHRPLAERPDPQISLDRAVYVLRSSPSIGRAAGLTQHEINLVLGTETMIQAERARQPASRGRPKGDIVYEERVWAAGQIAKARSVDASSVNRVIDGILGELGDALQALDDAGQDELYWQESRAAAALLALPPAGAAMIDEAAFDDGMVTWRGRTPAQLAVDGELPVVDLQTLIDAIDAYLIANP